MNTSTEPTEYTRFICSEDATALELNKAIDCMPMELQSHISAIAEAAFACGVCIGAGKIEKIILGSLSQPGAA